MAVIQIKKSKAWLLLLVIPVLISCFFILGLSPAKTGYQAYSSDTPGETIQDSKNYVRNTKVEIYHFHRTRQCYSCIRLGELAEETVNTYFKDELESGKIVFAHMNVELPENNEVVMKYGTTGSSLWIGVYSPDGGFSKENNLNVWYKLDDPQGFIGYLKKVIEEKLSGVN